MKKGLKNRGFEAFLGFFNHWSFINGYDLIEMGHKEVKHHALGLVPRNGVANGSKGEESLIKIRKK